MHRSRVSGLYITIPLSQNRLDNELDFAEEKEAYFQQLEKKNCQAEIRTRILRLKKEKFCGFALKEALTESESLWPRFNKDALALKKAKENKCLNVYIGQSQKHMN